MRFESGATPEDVLVRNCKIRPKKLQSVARRYDLAHAKGGLKESSLEREERLRQQRREKRKTKAREDFERKQLSHKKEKLRRLRLKRAGLLGDDDDDLAIQIQVSGKGLNIKGQPPSATVEGCMQDNSSHENRRNFKLTVETSDQAKTVEKDTTTSPDAHGSGPSPNAGVELGDAQPKPSTPTDTEKNDETSKDAVANQPTSDETTDSPELTLDDISDDGLSWSSDIDAPSDSESDDSEESHSDSDCFEKMFTPDKKDKEESSDEKRKVGPWNAVCVFGLRVYTKDARAAIEVIRKSDDGKTVKIPSSQDWKAVAGG